eukprot:CAMPEP_0182871298 /NCGR_PEP_ID=MMETSP0034_2-20130328/11043_1 /TAXON_ID=156128 /ORGANISM="Nephroselmis pyriformis, Strain CCMP717" /LENGTH=87 /DNA_ID=CAMNT_0025003843 /DNA_START=184 /DNA_END=443 /DNA_ORIENTATION=+
MGTLEALPAPELTTPPDTDNNGPPPMAMEGAGERGPAAGRARRRAQPAIPDVQTKVSWSMTPPWMRSIKSCVATGPLRSLEERAWQA